MNINGKEYTIQPCAILYGADLRGADLRGADLHGADLRDADLHGAHLYGAHLYGADLYGANLYGANLHGADLRGADLRGADLRDANLRGANLYGADLRDANLHGADLYCADLPSISIVPEHGAFDGWKKCKYGTLVRVRIPADAPRSNATGRKCRAAFVDVIEVVNAAMAASAHDNGETIYRVGERVTAHEWCEDRWQECAGGIHFFITRKEAEEY